MRSDRYEEYMKDEDYCARTVRIAFFLGGMIGILATVSCMYILA